MSALGRNKCLKYLQGLLGTKNQHKSYLYILFCEI